MSNENRTGQPMILLVEDNPADVRLACEVLTEAGIESSSVLIARDGGQALKMIRSEEEYSTSPTPDLILLDLNLPVKSGLEVLTVIKQTPHLRRIPIIVLTTSRAESDVLACYDAHANAFLTKPVDMEQFAQLALVIRDFWLLAVQLPGRPSA